MHVARGLHVAQDVVLKLRNRLQLVWYILVLLNVPNDFGGLGTLVEIDQVGWGVGGNAVFDESQVG